MNKFCVNCGKALESSYNACPNCGTKINGNQATSSVILAERNIIVAILLSLVTCGIYGIYWFIKMTDESNQVSGNTSPTGGMAFLFSLLTCGIYTYYWNYKIGQKMYQAGQMHGKDIADNSVIYLILSLVGFGIVNYCLIQSDLNKFSK